jgi:hypothetical protein
MSKMRPIAVVPLARLPLSQVGRLPILAIGLFFSLVASAASPGDEAARLFSKPSHLIVEDHPVQHVLDAVPQPFLDWGLIQAGSIEYVRQDTREVVPLNGHGDVHDPRDVDAVPVAVPSGIRVRTQPATVAGSFAQVLFPPQFPWEKGCEVHTLLCDRDGVYRLWYRCVGKLAYAESMDFKTWKRPLGAGMPFEGSNETNLIRVINVDELANSAIKSIDEAAPGASGAFFMDDSAPPSERFKCTFLAHLNVNTDEYAKQNHLPLSAMTGALSTVIFGAVSADGIRWRVLPKPLMLHDADTMTVAAYDVLLHRYVMYTRLYELGRRTIAFAETDRFDRWPLPRNMLTPGPEDPPTLDFYASGFAPYPRRPEIRTMLCLAYNRGKDNSDIRLATSRDAHTFHFVPGAPMIRPGRPGNADAGFISTQPGLVRRPDGAMLVFCEPHRFPHKFPRRDFPGGVEPQAMCWPADRLAAIESPERGEFTTLPMLLKGQRIVLNLQTDSTGGIEVELRDEHFSLIPGRTFADADTLAGDHTALTVSWKGNADVSGYSGREVYLQFRLRAAKLFSIAANTNVEAPAAPADQR